MAFSFSRLPFFGVRPGNRGQMVHWLDTTPVDSNDVPCRVDSLDVKVRVSGLYARVDQTFSIYNPNKRRISANVTLPLPDRAVVCGYALDIDGVMVDGVVVEQERARVVFETEQRRGADPGLVETVRGNTYRTRVYPVLGRDRRTVRVSYVAPLLLDANGSATLDLPMPPEQLRSRTLQIDVEMLDCPAPVVEGIGNALMSEARGLWSVSTEEHGIAPESHVRVSMPALPESFALLECDAQGTVWFAASQCLDAAKGEDAEPITALTVLWDASGSRAGVDHAREFELVQAYCAGETVDSLELIVFADGEPEVHECSDAAELLRQVKAVRYDGGTNLPALARALADADELPQHAYVLFTDGIDTLSDEPFVLPSACNALAVVSGTARDLESMRQACRGLVFDVAQAPRDADALAQAFAQDNPLRMLDVRAEGIADVCDVGLPGARLRAVIGKLCTPETVLSLGDSPDSLRLRAEDARSGEVLASAWAARRVSMLSPRAVDHTEELLALGRRFGVVSPVTSLLVLETLDQWLEYDIEPPETLPHMRDSWRAAQEGKMHLAPDSALQQMHRNDLVEEWRRLRSWWERDYRRPETKLSGRDYRHPVARAGFCPQCGRPFTEGFAFCTGCGSRIDQLFEAQPLTAGSAMPDMASGHTRFEAPAPVRYRYAASSAPMDMDISLACESADEMTLVPSASSETAGFGGAGSTAAVRVQPWMPDAPYLGALDKAKAAGGQAARDAYFQQRNSYAASPSFFVDCAGWFMANGDADFGLRVLSNLAELRIEDAALLRVMAWRLREAGKLEQALVTLRRVARLRSEDSQSYRDLALVLDELARLRFGEGDEDAAREHAEEAARLYEKCAFTNWDRHPMSIALFAVEEYNVLRAWADAQTWRVAPDLPSLGEDLEGVLDCDLRITLAWDADETDVDIHVTEPSGEEAYYAHSLTMSGGRVSEDITDGYGPELYEIRKADDGVYRIRAHYYASHQQTVFGPATCTLTVYTDWGRPTQAQQVTSMRLNREHEMIPVGSVTYGDAESEPDAPGNTPSPDAPAARDIQLGMTIAEVRALLGAPDEEPADEPIQMMTWTWSGGNAIRVQFADGVVSRVLERMSWGEETIIRQ